MANPISEELSNKFNELSAKHKKLLATKQRLEDSIKTVEGHLQDCRAASRLFNIDLNVSQLIPPEISSQKLDHSRPTIRDFILDNLKQTYPRSMKAKALQENYELIYGGQLHYKTVGMSLYRLSQDKLARREGRQWFYQPTADEQYEIEEHHHD